MGALTRWFLPTRQERRSLDTSLLRTLRTGEVGATTPSTAMQIAAVYACVRVIATNIATLPLVLMQRSGDRRTVAGGHPLYNVLRYQPNPEMTSIQLRMALGVHLALYGNAYAQIVIGRGGRVRELWPLRPDRIQIERTEAGALIYRYTQPDGGIAYLPKGEVMHIAHMSFDGQVGLSPITMARRAFDTKVRMEEYGAAFWQNDASPGIVLSYPGSLNPDKVGALRRAWDDRHRGPGAAGRTAVLDGGVEVTTLSIPQTDAQFLESQKFTRQEIAALFGVPAHMINDLDRATFSNIEEQAQEFVDYTLMPYIEGWQQAIHRDLLTPDEREAGYYGHFRTQALLRGKHIDRAQYYTAMQQVGAMSPNDIRQLEDMNPVEGGDVYLVPLNMAPVQDAGNASNVTSQASQDGEGPPDEDTRRALLEQAGLGAAVTNAWVEDARVRLAARIGNDVRQAGAKALRQGGGLALSEWGESLQSEWRQAGEAMLARLREVRPAATPDVGAWVASAYQAAVRELIAP
jgi:HK97 family phage portal protein